MRCSLVLEASRTEMNGGMALQTPEWVRGDDFYILDNMSQAQDNLLEIK